MTSTYQEDLAYIHHVGFGDLVQGATPGLLHKLREAGIDHGLVVDLGCGGGLWLRALLDAGYVALGVDAADAFVKLARATAPDAEVRLASAYEVELPACNAVTAIGEVLCYVAPDDGDPPPLAALCRRVFAALRPGGLFVFDVIVDEPGDALTYRNWRAGDDWAVLLDVEEDRERHRLDRDIVAFRAIEGAYRRSSERHRQYLFAPDEIEAALTDAGFAVETGRCYGAFQLPPRRMAFTARKAGD